MKLILAHEQAKSLYRLLTQYERQDTGEVVDIQYLDDNSRISWDLAKEDKNIEIEIPD